MCIPWVRSATKPLNISFCALCGTFPPRVRTQSTLSRKERAAKSRRFLHRGVIGSKKASAAPFFALLGTIKSHPFSAPKRQSHAARVFLKEGTLRRGMRAVSKG